MLDFHVHVLSPEMIKDAESIYGKDPYFAMLCQGPEKALATADEVVEAMDSSGVEVSVIFGYAFRDMELCRMANDYVIESLRRFPGRLKGFACVPPLHSGMEREVIRCKEAGLEGVGELFPDGQGFDIAQEPDTRRLAGIVRETGLCLFLHANERVGHHYPGKGSTGPEQAWAFASRYPDLRLVLAHWGGGLAFYELMPEVRRTLANVYYDTAADPFLYDPGIYRVAREASLIHKILLGTDFPLLGAGRYLRRLKEANLGEEEFQMVIAGNARRFLAGGDRK